MPRQSVWFVRASLACLLTGFTLGALILAQKGVPYDANVWSLLPVHIELLLVGWLMQLAFGVAFWILPRFGPGATRGPQKLIWASFALLNTGIMLVVLQLWLPAALLAGRAAEALGVLLYIVGSWKRIKPLAVGPEKIQLTDLRGG